MPLALFFLGATMAVAGAGDALPVMLTVGSVSEVHTRPGDSATVTIRLKVMRGYHVNANPAANDLYIPLEIVFADTSFAVVGRPLYPKGKTWRLKDSDENLLVYGGAVKIIVPLAIPKNVQPGEYALYGTVDYQACDDAVCFMPQSRAVSVKVLVER
ncbi:MAG: protein-disulfide reductase DsbD family protein [bacterium]|nr:protein-disulfide reductase DsbD family protein [bacterium]